MARENIYFESKPRYGILDGLRGVAALMVILFHCFETYSWETGVQIINHGYLAVDFFFILSGFVIGYAYDDRWDKMTICGFFKRRLVRLHPMVIAGTVIGALLFFLRDCSIFPVCDADMKTFLLAFVMAILMIPCGTSIGPKIGAWDEFNPFNGPNWTLTYEYIANILYALIFRHLPKAAIASLCVISAFLTLNLTLGLDVFGNLPEANRFTVIGGWNLTGSNIMVGFTRMLYPFLCGLLLSRICAERRNGSNPSGSPICIRGGFWIASLILIVIFSIPQICGKPGIPDGLFQAAAILVVFPVVIMIGAGSNTTDCFTSHFCKFLGDLSFPLYITHYPFMYIQMGWVLNHPDAPLWIHIAVNAGCVLISIIVAWGCHKAYDIPVRQWLTEHWLKRRHNHPGE